MGVGLLPEGQFRKKISAQLSKLGMDPRDLAKHIGASDGYLNKVLRDHSIFPSKYFLLELCRVLGLDFDEVLKSLVSDKIRRDFGCIPKELAGRNPAVEPFHQSWRLLTQNQQQALLTTLKIFIASNRRKRLEQTNSAVAKSAQ